MKSIDPKSSEYSWQSPYAYHRNSPINFIDFLGLGDPPKLNWEYFNKRHMLSGDFSVNTPKGGVTSVVTNPAWQNQGTIQGFYDEAMILAKKTGNIETNVTLKNGTTWSINTKSGHFNPVSGEGITNLSNPEIAALRAAKSGSASGEAIFENLAKNKSLPETFSPEMQNTLHSLSEIEGVSEATALKHIGGKMSETKVSSSEFNASKSKFGSAGKYIKWGGRALLVVALANDIYDVYESKHRSRTVIKKMGGWIAASTFSYGAGVAMSWLEGAPGLGTIAHGIVTIGAGVVGYFVGQEVTVRVHDWYFKKLKEK